MPGKPSERIETAVIATNAHEPTPRASRSMTLVEPTSTDAQPVRVSAIDEFVATHFVGTADMAGWTCVE